ncbi:MAG: HlyC/CorC family transporter [Oscillospiraceae bacterium]|nr:HlyC/CorC family transporter [Oscillospiraceae bacterium]
MGSSTGSILFLGFLIMMSAFFSATETAFSTANRIRLKNMADDGNRKARLVLQMLENYDGLLTTILIGNNIVNIGSSSLATVIFVSHFGDAGVALSTTVMTVLVLIFGEISPKSLAKESPESFAMFSAPFLRMLSVIFTPFTFIFALWKKLLSLIFKFEEDRGITEEELITMVGQAAEEGGIDAGEEELIRSAIEFDDLEVDDILTPRVEIVAVDIEDSSEEIEQVFQDSGYTRLPVYKGSVDNIVGVVNLKDFYKMQKTGQLQDIMKPVIFTAQTTKLSDLLKRLQSINRHMAVVVDEYGGTLGLVTMEDILEELVGEIWDEHDEVVKEFEKLSETEYRILGSASLEKTFRLLEMRAEVTQATVSGWVNECLGDIPEKGNTFDFENLHVVVEKVSLHRAEAVLVTVKPEEDDQD